MDYYQHFSIKLSETLDEIGLQVEIVKKKRRKEIMKECLETAVIQILGNDAHMYVFGSQIEGSTVEGSDTDCVLCDNRVNVIRGNEERKNGVRNYMMIQSEFVPPGYCLLKDENEELLKNDKFFKNNRYTRNGPAETKVGRHGFLDADRVYAFPCKSWPIQASKWLSEETIGEWPTNEMKRKCHNTRCFIVAVGSRRSDTDNLEWRISTSLAERVLMFHINITQIRCYTVMKMITKEFINTKYPKTISSFMCKSALFQSIANSKTNSWREDNILHCLNYCLSTLYMFVYNGVCPHFIIPKNNLFKGNLTQETKQFILKKLNHVLQSKGKALTDIMCDMVGPKVSLKVSGIIENFPNTSPEKTAQVMSNSCLEIDGVKYLLLSEMNHLDCQSVLKKLSQFMYKLLQIYIASKRPCKIACCFIAHILCRTYGSVLAGLQIKQSNMLSSEICALFSCGLQYDISSSKLKLATFRYCIQDNERLQTLLKEVEESYDLSIVEPVCRCYHFPRKRTKDNFNEQCFQTSKGYSLLKRITAACVIFLPCEIDCCPHELQYEMFRTVPEDVESSGEEDRWMYWAVLDSLSYLYFLQYKTYDRLQKVEEKEEALFKLKNMIQNEVNLGHRETALNLLGQCMEHEGQISQAFHCYCSSLQIRGKNNAAKVLLCRLFSSLLNSGETLELYNRKKCKEA